MCLNAASHHLGLGVSFAPLQATADTMNHYRAMCAEHGWEPTANDLIFRATIMIGETEEEAQEGVRRYWSSRGMANSTPAARAVTALAGRLRGSSRASFQNQDMRCTASSPAAFAREINFVGNPDTVFRQIKRMPVGHAPPTVARACARLDPPPCQWPIGAVSRAPRR